MSELPTVGLDPAWIAEHVVIDGERPVLAEFAGFIGTGQMSRNARFRLVWDGGERGDRPATVVVKIPSGEASTRSVSFEHDVYAKECHFYAHLADLVDVSTPGAHHVHFDPPNDFTIILDDLDRSEQGDQFTDPTDDQVVMAIEQAAALQAPVWGATDSAVFDLLRSDPVERAAGSEMMMPIFHAVVIERLGARLDADVAALLEHFTARVGDWIRASAQPTTLVHGDFRPDNFMFGLDDTAPPIAIVDWQTLSLGTGVTDVAYLLGGALTPERRHTDEDTHLAHYREALARRGVDYDPDQCRREYALGSLHGLVIAMTATTMADETERGDALFTLMLNRHGRHALDLDAMALITRSS